MIPILMTVDTEGDDLWSWHQGKKITTNNALYIAPFQDLCEKYGIVPVYLTNYEMIMSDDYVSYIKNKVEKDLCEIGMHVHAWNSPPEVILEGPYSGNPYITEYKRKDIFEKHKYLRDLIKNRIGADPISYRAGRWATNDELFDILEELGFLIDCSVTPGIKHKAPGITVSHANNYRKEKCTPNKLRNHLWEVPMTTDLKRSFKGKSLKRILINLIRGEERWLRPALQSEIEMKKMINDCLKSNVPYLMFMIHSSELMPGGSPYCLTESDVEQYLNKLENMFIFIKDIGKGYSLKQYYSLLNEVGYEKSESDSNSR